MSAEWGPRQVPQTSEEDIRRATVGPVDFGDAPIVLVPYDPRWPATFDREASRIRAALASLAIRVEHVGSTSVPGLDAKPIIDIVLAVPDSSDEAAYVSALKAAGYVLHNREPGWFEHRMFKGPEADVNLHVFSAGAAEIDRMILFRDWLRSHDDDRDAYLRVKRELAGRTWRHVQHYADAKTPIVREIMARATAGPEAGADSSAP
ncbi:MAG TPA: GrpB family protein [Streptosporangiaceae bacterium]|nr:GrpB family protein [Streptosporangiaceae bacterium]